MSPDYFTSSVTNNVFSVILLQSDDESYQLEESKSPPTVILKISFYKLVCAVLGGGG